MSRSEPQAIRTRSGEEAPVLAVPTAGYDRVGTSRPTQLGWFLVLFIVVFMITDVRAVDHDVVSLAVSVAVAALLVGTVVPLVMVRRIRCTARSERDATVGDHVPIELALMGRASVCAVRLLDPSGPWTVASAPGEGVLAHLADRRGVFHGLRVEVSCSAPLGVFDARRVHMIELPFGVEVAPRAIAVDWHPSAAPVHGEADPVGSAGRTGDLVRSVRPYVPGDPANLVHWPSTARTGALVVRELERPSPVGQAVVVDLRNLGMETERAAAYALGACRAVLAAGGELLLATCEVNGPVTGRVRTPLDAGRRLARAVPGPPGEVPEGWPVVEIGR